MEQRRREPLRAGPRANAPASYQPSGERLDPWSTQPGGQLDSQAPPPAPVATSNWSASHDVAPVSLAGRSLSSPGSRLSAYLLDVVLFLVTLGIGWFIWSLVTWSNGQSPAKSILGMRCVSSETGKTATWGTMALREWVGKGLLGAVSFGITTIVSAFMIFSSPRQGIWDKIATTVVVDG